MILRYIEVALLLLLTAVGVSIWQDMAAINWYQKRKTAVRQIDEYGRDLRNTKRYCQKQLEEQRGGIDETS